MAFHLTDVVPWGRSFDEYAAMFSLTDADLRGRVLGCADGPASFNVEATARGVRVVSADPLYAFTAAQIRTRVAATTPEIADQTRRHADEFVWTHVGSVEAMIDARLAAMRQFIDDFAIARHEGRYVAAALPGLPFASRHFDLALCSHFLFLYSAHVDARFHIESVAELCRVAADVRIFPLLELGATTSRHLAGTVDELRRRGLRAEIVRVPYEFQRGGNEMLRVTCA